jgi:hypothetical protein
LAFLAEDAETRVFCYGNAAVRKDEQTDEVLRFVEYWHERTGRLPEELVFDSRLTTYANLSRLNTQGINFITLRRRSQKMLAAIESEPPSAWRRIELDGVARAYKRPRVIDRQLTLRLQRPDPSTDNRRSGARGADATADQSPASFASQAYHPLRPTDDH